MKKIIVILAILSLVGCATTPKFKPPDPFQSAQLAIATTVTIDPALRPVLYQAVKEAKALVVQDFLGAVNLILNRVSQTQRYAPLVVTAMQLILDNYNDLKLRPEMVVKMQVMLSNLEVILAN